MKLDLEHKVAIVTGGSKGIGFACAKALVEAGARVAIVGRDPAGLDAAATALGPREVMPLAHDLSVAGNEERIVAATLDQFGSLDILVNSAGSSAGGSFSELSDHVWRQSFELKIMSTVRMIRAVLPAMLERGAGRIVSIAGNSGLHHDASMLPGAMANTTLMSLTKGLADEVARCGVVLNCVSPGPTLTERLRGIIDALAAREGVASSVIEARMLAQTPTQRFCEPRDIARAVLFLASGLTRNVCGINLTIDGGATR
jgi:3-oxoacyl-[acyl-carrier protein] reductase